MLTALACIDVILGNLSGNAIALGLYAMEAAGVTGNNAAVRGIAVASLTFACVVHAAWRKGGIVLNNLLAFMKVSMLLAIIIIGFAKSAGASFGNVSNLLLIIRLVEIGRHDVSCCSFR